MPVSFLVRTLNSNAKYGIVNPIVLALSNVSDVEAMPTSALPDTSAGILSGKGVSTIVSSTPKILARSLQKSTSYPSGSLLLSLNPIGGKSKTAAHFNSPEEITETAFLKAVEDQKVKKVIFVTNSNYAEIELNDSTEKAPQQTFKFTEIKDVKEQIREKETDDYKVVCDAIYRLAIRGAPAIGVAGAYACVLAANKIESDNMSSFIKKFISSSSFFFLK